MPTNREALPAGACAEEVTAAVPIRRALLEWYRLNQRNLPWRSTGDPYAVWVSEVMLQQTQAQTVVPYYQRWMARFPTLRHVAEAPVEEVLRYWAGLGYYARARCLHAAARRVVEVHGGVLPADRKALLALPGIGRYTAGAILSIAFGLPAPVVDGNVGRVLSRLFLVAGDPKSRAGQQRLWELAGMLAEGEAPGELNQSLMELGATLCTPQNPACGACPVNTYCRAHATGQTAAFPHKSPRPAMVAEEHVSVVLGKDHAVLLTRRPEGVRWGGLWEFPRAVRAGSETLAETARRAARDTLSVEVEPGETLAVVQHTVTHHRVTLYALRARVLAGHPRAVGCAEWRWVSATEAPRLPLPAPQARVLRSVLAARGRHPIPEAGGPPPFPESS
ncbi:MAG: A/G-specific adenine glycosylase [Armatimonadota bacterium]|nr:A/G-specific adenine glycosylase [Armatimonadota bacterium]